MLGWEIIYMVGWESRSRAVVLNWWSMDHWWSMMTFLVVHRTFAIFGKKLEIGAYIFLFIESAV